MNAPAMPDADSNQKTKALDGAAQSSELAVCGRRTCHGATNPLEPLEKGFEDTDEFDRDIQDKLIDDLDENIDDELDDD